RSVPFNDEAANHNVVSRLNKAARGDVIKLRRHDRHDRIPLDKRLVGVFAERGADGPTIRGRSARHPVKGVVRRGGRVVGRGDDGPGWPVPVRVERVEDVVGGAAVADSPAIRRRSARYTKGYVFLRDVGQDDGPSCPVPMFDERVGGGEVGVILADGPAIRGRSARYTREYVFVRGAGVGRGDDGPR